MKLIGLAVLAVAAVGATAGSFKSLVDEPSFMELSVIPEVLFEGKTHYGNPSEGCKSDEKAVRIQGVQGGICTPECKGGQCPSDVPSGSTATPSCILQTPTGQKYCALRCGRGTTCGTGASCKMVGFGIGICTYDQSEAHSLESLS
eukprot:CAMPEP_0203748012 /NCGR_PEP_ID=MMETSP0098-20131031/3000_1 /ASSEMBLY_ACC=CAM_ASM_000208 /TAXON_ID=96639 /ORGANISM=" , Strain NY0313808BC1" /LENGTH=145 /DNA_ID=CAMNT_0050636617 /DNA_START=173 /DNA_END=610 /DNA_ORIENTATION=-